MSEPVMAGHGGSPPATQSMSPAWRLLVTLGGAGALAGLMIVTTFQKTLPAIEANKARVLEGAIREVLRDPPRYDTLYLVSGALTARLPQGADPKTLEKVYLGRREDGSRAGFAIASAQPGFADVIQVLFGYDAAEKRVIAMKVVANKETPGLGDKIVKDTMFVNEFENAAAPLLGVKQGAGKGNAGEVDMITGATISSRTVIRIINDAVTRWQPLLDAYREETP